jgi:hypothetical protein
MYAYPYTLEFGGLNTPHFTKGIFPEKEIWLCHHSEMSDEAIEDLHF